MSKRGCYKDNEVCSNCGLKYKNFTCSLLTFSQVKEQMFNPSEEDPKKWKYKRKKGVLGYWHMIKKREWEIHLEECSPTNKDVSNFSELEEY